MPDQFAIDVSGSGVGLSIGVNHVPLINDLSAEGIKTVRPVTEWIMPAGNAFTAYLFWPEDREFEPGVASVTARIFRPRPDTSPPEPMETLAEFTWPPDEGPEAYPHTHEQPFKVKDPPPTRLWNEAETIEQLTDLDRRQMVEQAEGLRTRLMDGDAAGAVAMTEYKWRDDARAHEKEEQRMLDVAEDSYKFVANKGDKSSQPLEAKDAEFEIVGGQKVVSLTAAGAERPIVIRTRTMRFGFPLYFARLDGQWTIVR